jgi:hypothetical protein
MLVFALPMLVAVAIASGGPSAAGQTDAAAPPILSGRVVDAGTAAPIAGARVTLTELDTRPAAGPAETHVLTDRDGRFLFPVRGGFRGALSISMVGYIFVRRIVEVPPSGLDLVIPVTEGSGTYRETIDVSPDQTRPPPLVAVAGAVLGSAGLQDLRGVATDDPMRAVQALPGVATGDDFRAEFSVRGAPFRHAGVVIDGTPTSLMLHTVRGEENTGSIAMLNTDVLQSVTLLSGAHGRRYGDWLGATLDVNVREGSRDRLGVRGAISGTSASAVVEGPLGSGRPGSWLVSIRRSYLDWLIRKLEPDFNSTLGFFDGYAKVVVDVTARQQLQILFIGGEAVYRDRDASPANGLDRAQSASTLGSVSWRSTLSRAVVTQRVSFVASDFRNRGPLGQELARGYTQGVSYAIDAIVPLAAGWTFEAGALRERQQSNDIARVFQRSGAGIRVRAERDRSPRITLMTGWVQVTHEQPGGGVALGVRVSDRTIANRPAVSPWILAERRTGAFTWRAGIGGAAQYPDPAFAFAPDEAIGPERSLGGDVGVEHRLGRGLTWRATAYSRSDRRGLRPAVESRILSSTGQFRADDLLPVYTATLDGTSRGAEIVLARQALTGVSGWIGYSWARTRMRDVVTGETFDGDFDQRHTLNAVVTGRLSYRTSVGAKLRIGSNTPIVGYFEGTPGDLRLASARNGTRLPRYARLDLRASRTYTMNRRRLTLFVEVMNALGRRNYGQAEGTIRPVGLEAIGFVERLIPRVPSAGMLIEF